MEAITVVTAAVENGQRNAASCHQIQYQPVASGQMGVTEPHLAKSVIFVRITARNPKGKIWCKELEGDRQRLFQASEIFRATYLPGQSHIQRPGFFSAG